VEQKAWSELAAVLLAVSVVSQRGFGGGGETQNEKAQERVRMCGGKRVRGWEGVSAGLRLGNSFWANKGAGLISLDLPEGAKVIGWARELVVIDDDDET